MVKKTKSGVCFRVWCGYLLTDMSLPRHVLKFLVRADENILRNSTLSSNYGYFLFQSNQSYLDAFKW